MTEEQKSLFMKLRYLNDRLKQVNGDKEKLEKEITKLSIELFNSINNTNDGELKLK